jgi:hypothetical protein
MKKASLHEGPAFGQEVISTNKRLTNLRRCWHRRYVLANYARAIRCQKPPLCRKMNSLTSWYGTEVMMQKPHRNRCFSESQMSVNGFRALESIAPSAYLRVPNAMRSALVGFLRRSVALRGLTK